MDLEQIKTEYIQAGGSESDLEGLEDEETLNLLLQSQKMIAQATSEEEEQGEKKSDLEKLEELRASLPQDISSQEYMEQSNKVTELSNKVRSRFGLPAKNRQFTDTDLKDLLQFRRCLHLPLLMLLS